jgi:Flp pilus assembly pilin Flp
MTDAKSAWHEAGERFTSLGTKLKVHYEQQRGQDTDQAKAEVRDALHRLTNALDDAFDAIGTAARDDAVKGDVKQVGQSLVTALGATFSQISAEVQRQYAARTGSGSQPGTDPGPAAEPGPGPGPESGKAPGKAAVTAADPAPLTEPPAAPTTEDGSAQQPPKVEPGGTP